MRCLYPDAEYFAYLDGMRASGTWDAALAPIALTAEYPGLRLEEARAVFTDWRAAQQREARLQPKAS